MKIAAIIAEYNPFHNGHKYHIEETRKNCDAVIAVMSGSFVQRGECAVYSKWQRAASAVKNGADLVLELPTYYATASSSDFARGAVKLIDSLNCADILSFGSESCDVSMLSDTASYDETEAFSSVLKKALKSGQSYPKAKAHAMSVSGINLPIGANDRLACEYLKAISKASSKLSPMCVMRNVEHDSNSINNSFASASMIRSMLQNGDDISSFVPELSTEEPLFYSSLGKLIMYAVHTSDLGLYKTRSASDRELINTISRVNKFQTLDSFLHNIKTKRYTMSRVKRTLLHILLNSGEYIPDFEPYARVLALNDNGAAILKQMKKCSKAKIITKLSAKQATTNPGLLLDVRATDIRSIARGENSGQDFTNSPFIIK